MAFFSRQKPIMELDFEKLCNAFIYRAIYMYLDKPHEKWDKDSYGDICGGSIDLYFMNDGNQIIIELSDWIKDTSFQPYIAIHQSNKEPIDVEKIYKGMEKRNLNILMKRTSSTDYIYVFNQYLITSGGYFKGNKLYSSLSLEEFMENGGNNIAEIFKYISTKDFPYNLHQHYKNLLDEDWKKRVYDEIIKANETKKFDIYESELRYHISKKQFKFLKTIIFECLHIDVLNERKRNLFVEQ